MPELRGASDDLALRACELYEREIRPVVEAGHRGEYLVLNVDTGEYEMDPDDLAASQRARTRFPSARLFTMRVGYPTAYRLARGEAAMLPEPIEAARSDLAEFCRRNHVRRLAIFGSALREDFSPQSDLDLLAEFQPGYTPGLAFFGMQEELAQILGRPVDLNTPWSLSKYFRDRVLEEAVPPYTQPCGAEA